MHWVVCLFTPQLSLVLIAPTHGWMGMLSRPWWLVLHGTIWFIRPKTITHQGTNRARRSATSLIKTNELLQIATE